MSENMRRDFPNREELITYLREQFPDAAKNADQVSEIRGGYKIARQTLQPIDPVKYAQTRNFMNGAVTRLSPYLRHGVMSLREVRDYALEQVENGDDALKLLSELGWRDYWQRLYIKLGDRIWDNQEDYKTGFSDPEYATELPEDIRNGTTGLACIDAFSQQLHTTGYLHNHIRMWLAAYIVHWRRVAWQVGAKWFLEHLLDGDPASNNLSWQWVASTFSHKPYFFNRENLERYTDGIYCRSCPLQGKCDFEGSYEQLGDKLFPQGAFGRKANSQSWQKGKPRKPSRK